jgi:hypothetical protein
MVKVSDVRISHFQLAALLSVSVLFTYTSTLPIMADHSMGRFISLFIAVGIKLMLYIPLLIYSAKREKAGFIAINNGFFKWFFGCLLIIRFLYGALLAVVKLEFRVTCTALPYLSPFYFTLILFGAVLYGSLKGVQASARVAPIVLALYIFLIVTVSVSVSDKIDVIRIYSPFSSSTRSIVAEALKVVMRNDEILFFAVLCGFVRGNTEGKGNAYKAVWVYLPFVLIVGLWINFLYNSVLGRFINSTACQMYAISSYSRFNIIERMDGFFITTGILGGVLKIILSFVCVRAILFHLLPNHGTAAKYIASLTLLAVSVTSFFTHEHSAWLMHIAVHIGLFVVLGLVALVMPFCGERNVNNEESKG